MTIMVLAVAVAMAQAPEKFTYQAVVRNASNSLVANAPVGVRVSILQGSASGSAVYVETQTATTNANGLVTLSIGGGNVQQGAFADIDWANGTYFLKTETDPDGGTNYSITSTQQMLSVPYALYAKEAGNGFSGDYNDLVNVPQIPQIPADVSAFNNDAGYITGYTETDPTVPAWAKEANKPTYNYSEIVNTPELPTVPTNVSAFTNDAGYLTNYTETDPTVPAWAKEANKPTYNYSEIVNTPTIPTVPTNVSAFTNDVGYITTYTETDPQFNAWDKNYNDLTNKPVLFDGDYNSLTNQPTIPTVPTNVSAFMNDAGYLTEYTEQQVLSISNDTIFLTGGSFVKLPAGFDGDYNSLTNTPTIPTVPDSVSAFTNDAGYITMADIQVLLDEMNHKIDSLENLINNQQPVAPDTTVEPDFHCGTSTLTDYDGNVYNTVQIGNQCWMKENMRTMHYSDGSEIQNAHQSNVNGEYIPEYGYLYDWSAVMHGASSSSAVPSGVQGICPTGWHVPSDAEWMELLAYVGSQSDYVCGSDTSYISKALADTMGWNEATADCTVGNDPSANNTTGFSVLPAGHYRSQFDLVIGSGMMANFWSCTESSAGNPGGAWARVIANSTAYVSYTSGNRSNGFSVRCLRDQSGNTAQVPTVTTSLVSEVATTSATCGGNVTSDGGASVTVRGVCWSTSQNPTVNDSHTTDGSGTGSFTSNITGLTANTTYYVRAYATNSAGTAYGEEVTFTTLSAGGTAVIDEKSCPEAQTVTDHEGNVYATVQIGNQCWMRDNLRTTTSPSTGTYLIPAADANYTYTGKQARWYNNDSATYAPMNYGLLYNWNAAVDTFNTTYGETSVNTSNSNAVSVTFNGHRRGICPAGWHLPSDAEWTTLTDYVSSQSEFQCGGNSDYIAKALASTEGWNSYSSNCVVGNDPSTNNATGFSAVPAGTCDFSSFRIAGYVAYFWSSTQYYSYNAYDRNLDYSSVFVFRDYYYEKGRGRSVRCLCDESGGTAQEQPTATTAPATDLTATSATLNGTITNPDNVTVTAQGLEWKATTGGTYTQVNAMGETMAYSLTGLTANTSYTYRAFVTTANGTNYGAEVTFTTLSAGGTAVIDEKSCPEAQTVTDHEGNVYATVQIGNQCWMRDNLRTTTSPSTGTYLIAYAYPTSTGKQAFWYNNDSATCATNNYGLLYNWNAAVDTFNTAYGETSVNTTLGNAVSVTFTGPRRGICPAGWHLPSDAEWTTLTDYVSSQSEFQCDGNSNYIAKALASTEGWNSYSSNCVVGNDPSSNNATGFSAVPAGECSGWSFYSAGNYAYFWSSTQFSSRDAEFHSLYYYNAYVLRSSLDKYYGHSVRCLRD